MESTFINQACRAANLQSILRNGLVQSAMGRVIDAYTKIANEDSRGTRIRDAFTLKELTDEIGIPSKPPVVEPLADGVFSALLGYLNQLHGNILYVDERTASRSPYQYFLHRISTTCNRVRIGGVSFQPEHCSPKDSNIVYSDHLDPCQVHAGRIVSIFLHRRSTLAGTRIEATYVAVRRLVPLRQDDQKHDNFRRYKDGGTLYYDSYKKDVDVVLPKDILCHFARTPITLLPIERPCVHVLPLDRVRLILLIGWEYVLISQP